MPAPAHYSRPAFVRTAAADGVARTMFNRNHWVFVALTRGAVALKRAFLSGQDEAWRLMAHGR